MINDARDRQDGTTIECDLAIMGAGAAGITLAREFARGGVKVCLLESGGFEFEDETQLMVDSGQRAQINQPEPDVSMQAHNPGSPPDAGEPAPLRIPPSLSSRVLSRPLTASARKKARGRRQLEAAGRSDLLREVDEGRRTLFSAARQGGFTRGMIALPNSEEAAEGHDRVGDLARVLVDC